MFGGVPCGAHVWLSQGTTKKSRARPMGDPDVPLTRRGNGIACRFALGIAIAVVRQVLWAGEQPGSSVLPYMLFMQFVLNINMAGFGYAAGMFVKLWHGCILIFKVHVQFLEPEASRAEP